MKRIFHTAALMVSVAFSLAPITTSAQDILSDPSLAAMWNRMDIDMRESFFDEYRFALQVPVEINDVTDDVYGVLIYCTIKSAILQSEDKTVGLGRAWIVDDRLFTTENRSITGDFETANRVAANLQTFSGTVAVPILASSGRDTSGWTHGLCSLFIQYGDVASFDPDSRDFEVPRDCQVDDVAPALCSRPGAALNVHSFFGRDGFDATGQPLDSSQ
jgi:hypothetical protein